jgi:hypothetical protein
MWQKGVPDEPTPHQTERWFISTLLFFSWPLEQRLFGDCWAIYTPFSRLFEAVGVQEKHIHTEEDLQAIHRAS